VSRLHRRSALIHPSRGLSPRPGECWARLAYLEALMARAEVHSYGALLHNADLDTLLAAAAPVPGNLPPSDRLASPSSLSLLHNADLDTLLAAAAPVPGNLPPSDRLASPSSLSLLDGDTPRALVQGGYALTLVFESHVEEDYVRCVPVRPSLIQRRACAEARVTRLAQLSNTLLC
jgi:hypothetical protein